MQQLNATYPTSISHGKIILIGEHAVVYGQPAIAIPCTSVHVNATVQPSAAGIFINCALYNGNIDHIPDSLNHLKTVITHTLTTINQSTASFCITITSTIPLERGMGSSAAVSGAIIRGLFHYFNQPLSTDTLLQLIGVSEKMVHGNPSGLDAAIVTFEQPMLFQKERAIRPITFQLHHYLIIADSGITGQTKKAVEQVATLKETNALQHQLIINKLGNITLQMYEQLQQKNGSAVGKLFNDAHQLLQQLTISHPTIDKLVRIANENGALGAKLTGGGLGGCLIALASNLTSAQRISHALKANGAANTFIQPI